MWKNLLSLVGGSSVQVYIYLALAIGGFGGGFYVEHLRFANYQMEVENVAKVQEEHNKVVEQQHKEINEGIKHEYENKLATVRSFYSSGVHNPSSGSMSGISPAPKGTDAETAYPILAGQCAETTLQVNLWQEWATQNGLIK